MPIVETVTTAAIQGFSGLLTKLATDHAARLASPEKAERIKTDLTSHMESTFKRCRYIKTLLNPNEPAEFLDIYATQRFRRNSIEYDQYGLVEFIRHKQNNVVVTGTGGSVKSMFMRYLWLSLFVNHGGRIPLFIELRAMNALSQVSLTDFLYYVLSVGRASISRKDFAKNLKRGDFMVLLDGFDELSSDLRERIQTEIIDFSIAYPKVGITVSGRPDERFSSWNSFTVVTVAPLHKSDVLELIKRAPFDEVSKNKFHTKVKSTAFYAKQKGFLENPLLASMMLLTFSYNYDIPDKMHLFYHQAFDALYQRHDSHKPGGYKRNFCCDLAEDGFKRLLSYFCLITYFEQIFEFDKDALISNIRKAISIEKVDIKAEDFASDLCDCVCLVVKDGLTYTFAHRSFQEYFAAYYLAFVTTKNIPNIIAKLSARHNDQAIPLLTDMNAEVFRENYVIPLATKYTGELQERERNKSISRFLRDLGLEFRIRWFNHGRDAEPLIMLSGETEFSSFVRLLFRLAPATLERRRRGESDPDFPVATALLQASGLDRGAEFCIRGGDTFWFGGRLIGAREFQRVDNSEVEEVFLQSGMHKYISEMLRSANTYIRAARKQSDATTDAMAELFGSG